MKLPRTNYGVLWPLLIGSGAVLVLAVLFAQAAQNSTVTTATLVTQIPSPPTIETPATTMTESPVPSVTQTPWIEPTATPLETEADIEAILTQKWITYATWQQFLTENPIVQSPPPTGIFEGGEVFNYPRADAIIQNHWQNIVNETGDWASIYAGSMYTDPTQGLVIVMGVSPQTYLTPIKAGAVHIVDVQNLHLVLLSENGTTFYFDVLGQSFVDSLTEVAPTVTPYRSSTPTATETPAPTVTLAPTCTPGPTPGPPAADVTPPPGTCS